MQKIKAVLSFFQLMLSHFRWKVILIILLGISFSVFQGVGIVMVIPLLEAFQHKAKSRFTPFFEYFNLEQSLGNLLLLYFLVLFLFAIFKALQILYTQRTISKFSNRINIDSIQKLLNSNWEFYLKVPSSQLLNMLNTEARQLRSLANQLFQFIQNVILIVIQLFFALWISAKLTLVLVFVLAVLFVLQRFVFRKNYDLGRGQIKNSEGIQKYLNETFKGIKLLKLHGLELQRGEEYKMHLDSMYHNEERRARVEAISDLVYTLSASMLLITIIWYSLTYTGITVSALLILLVLFSRVIAQTLSLVKVSSNITNIIPSYVKFIEVLGIADQHQNNSPIAKEKLTIDSIELRDINFDFGDKKILEGVNLKFEKGKFYVLTGPSGVGKTITSDLICGLITPKSGEILINGEVKSSEELKFYQSSTSYVLQDTVMFGSTIKANITFFEDYSDAEINTAVDKAGLRSLVDKLPDGLNSEVKEDNRGFSGGELQRMAIARAIIRKTPLIILDEVTNTLDRKNEDIILATINDIKKDGIVVLITHKEYLFDLADEVVRL